LLGVLKAEGSRINVYGHLAMPSTLGTALNSPIPRVKTGFIGGYSILLLVYIEVSSPVLSLHFGDMENMT